MTNAVTDTVLQLWKQSRKTKKSPSGWLSGNAVCCADKRGRGGMHPTKDGGWVWHCFNCQFKTGWVPGTLIGPKVKKLLVLLGASEQQIGQLGLEALRLREDLPTQKSTVSILPTFEPTPLPKDSLPIMEALEQYQDDNLVQVCNYIIDRKLHPEHYYWTPDMKRRFVIPFEWQGETVGWTARTIDRAKQTKYLSDTKPGYVYNLDEQDPDASVMMVCEGVLDADCIGAVALLGSGLSQAQIDFINRTHKRIVFVPDRDRDGLALAERVLDLGWSISLPNWGDCKDINDAVIRYGRTATLVSIMYNATSNKTLAQVQLKHLRARLKEKYERTH